MFCYYLLKRKGIFVNLGGNNEAINRQYYHGMSSLHGWTAGSSDSFTAFLVRGICTVLLTPAMPGSTTEQNCNPLLADFSDQYTGML